ncbi:MAG: sugar ABC transporter substrate-binding protein [Treponema sp.]|nr:sugar ABC transporter substrate-binding protein [Treponema sp.]
MLKLLRLPKFDCDPEVRGDRNRWFSGLAVLILALILVLCCRKPQIPGESDSTLVFAQWWEDEMEAGSLQALVDEFREQYPEINVRLDTRSYGEIRDRLLYAGENGEGEEAPRGEGAVSGAPLRADILGLDPRWIGELAENRRLEHLDADHTDSEGRTISFYVPRGTVALPLASFMTPLFYNVELLEAAGFDRPPKNRTEFLNAARAVTNPRKGQYGFALALNPENPGGIAADIYSWFRAANGPLLDRGNPRFNTPEAIEVLGFLRELYRSSLISPLSFSKTEAEKLEEFMDGRIAMMIASVRDIPRIRERDVPFGVTAVPGSASSFGKPAFGLYGWYAGISAASPNKADARTFLSFLAGNRVRLGAAARAVPGGGDAAGDYINDDPLFSKVYSIYEAGDVLEEFTGRRSAAEEETLVWKALYRMLEEGRTPAETAAAIQQGWEALRNRY